MTKPPVALLLLLVTAFGACSVAQPTPPSRLEWRKSSYVAPGFEEARQNCRVQAAADTLGTQPDPAVVDGDFVKCMRAAGWMLLDHGAK